MKKKLFGRAGAIGLAGLSAFSAMSIVASADIVITDKQDADSGKTLITGSAYKFSWEIQEITHSFTLTTNTKELQDSQEVTIPTVSNGVSSEKVGATNTELISTSYYAYSINQNNLITNVKQDFDDANALYKKTKADWEAYEYYTQNVTLTAANPNTTYSKSLSDGRTIKYNRGDAPGWVTVEKGVETPYAGSSPTATAKEYKYIVSPTKTELNMAQLITELGADIVKITNNKIEADSSGTYKLSTSGSTGSTGSTTVGGYAAYVIPSGYRTWSSTIYRSGLTWYPNLNAMYVATGSWAYDAYKVLTESYSSSKAYFDPVTGTYISNSAYTSSNYPYAVYITGTDTTRDETAIYKVGNLYYYTWTSAYNAANSDATKVEWIRDYTATGAYFSRITGYFYSTYEAAVAASNGYSTYVVAVNGSGYYYDDPYYYYYLMRAQSGSSSSSSSNLGGSSVTIGNKSGWSSVRTSIRNASTGTTLNVNMGSETSIPEEILSALNGKNVTVNFTLSNGSVISFNGRDISSPKDIYVKVTYNSTNIPSALIKKAKSVNNAVSSAQVSVTNNTFGGSGSLTVKFNTNRANYTAKLYRYNSSKNSLQLIDTSIVASTGRVTFDKVTQGGDYVIVLS